MGCPVMGDSSSCEQAEFVVDFVEDFVDLSGSHRASGALTQVAEAAAPG